VAIALGIAAQFTPTEDDWMTEMAKDQAELDKFKAEIVNAAAPAVITFWDQMGGSHFVAYPNGTYIQVPNPMGDDGVLAAHLGHLREMRVVVVDIGQADPYMFGHRVEWSDRPSSTTAF
jgi:hypothetical protein